MYRAHDERLDRDVALKVLPLGSLADEDSRRRFKNEALALSKLNHPNIATIHDSDTQAGVDFLVMEFIPGKGLDQVILEGGRCEEEVRGLRSPWRAGARRRHDTSASPEPAPSSRRGRGDGRGPGGRTLPDSKASLGNGSRSGKDRDRRAAVSNACRVAAHSVSRRRDTRRNHLPGKPVCPAIRGTHAILCSILCEAIPSFSDFSASSRAPGGRWPRVTGRGADSTRDATPPQTFGGTPRRGWKKALGILKETRAKNPAVRGHVGV